ncbi:MAG TPA: hypothetical protein VMH41_11445 [Mycobacteriales bacterium]|nr:hypothetical protein [Mycobacteriales bacterium]
MSRGEDPPRDGRRSRSWWLIPVVLATGATLGFVALAAPQWSHHTRVPPLIAVRADAAEPVDVDKPTAAPTLARHHRPRPKPSQSSAPPTTATATVTVVRPVRPVVTAAPTGHDHDHDSDDRSDDSHHGGSDDGSDDSKSGRDR